MMIKTEKKRQEKILLINAVLTNNGDAAITLALFQSLVKSGYEVTIATHYLEKIKAKYPELPLVSEVGAGFVFRKLPFLKKYLKPILFFRKKEFKEAHAVVAVPGGYMNSYYDFDTLIHFLIKCKSKKKRVGVYANSFGPFNAKHEEALIRNQDKLDVLMSRDKKSEKYLKDLKLGPSLVVNSNDAVFLLDNVQGALPKKKVAISVRSWTRDERNVDGFINLIKGLAEHTVEKGFEVEFLSTCQGIQNYYDDSKLAVEIYNLLEPKYQPHVTVDSSYYTLEEFRLKLTEYNFVIGTRLHMCLLSLKSNTPAFNVSYEFKGKESYAYLGLEDFSVDYNENLEIALEKLEKFISEKDNLRKSLNDILKEQNLIAENGFEQFMSKLMD